jgi:hypothetical protein
MNLREFCIEAIRALADVNKQDFVKTYLHYRYELLPNLFPHAVFGTNRSTEFFSDTLNYLQAPSELDKALKDATKEGQLYEINYLKWVKSHVKE